MNEKTSLACLNVVHAKTPHSIGEEPKFCLLQLKWKYQNNIYSIHAINAMQQHLTYFKYKE